MRIERRFVTTANGTRVVDSPPDYVLVDADTLHQALFDFVLSDGARLLGTINETGSQALATVWKNRVYLLCAEAAPD